MDKPSREFAWLVVGLALALVCFALSLSADDTIYPEKEWIKGGVATKGISGDCLYRPFVQTGTMDDDDDGNAQIIGFEPGNVRVSRIDGKVIYERVKARLFARRGFPARGCASKCPPYNE